MGYVEGDEVRRAGGLPSRPSDDANCTTVYVDDQCIRVTGHSYRHRLIESTTTTYMLIENLNL